MLLQRGRTALMEAIYYDNIECVKLLLAAGANTDIKDEVSMVYCAILLS